MKSLDCIRYTLMIIGALNWGLVGIFGVDAVAAFFGRMSGLSLIVYATIGAAALYDVLAMRSMVHRWNIHLRHHAAPAHA